MKIVFPPGARNNLFDRNPIEIVRAYDNTALAPAVDTQRWTYTVPAGKKFQIGNAQCHQQQDGVSGVGSNRRAYIAITPSGGALTIALIAQSQFNSNGENRDLVGLQGHILLAGDMIEGRTADPTSTGIVNGVTITMQGIEFDA